MIVWGFGTQRVLALIIERKGTTLDGLTGQKLEPKVGNGLRFHFRLTLAVDLLTCSKITGYHDLANEKEQKKGHKKDIREKEEDTLRFMD